MIQTLICEYDQRSGWRIKSVINSASDRIQIVDWGFGEKSLMIPAVRAQKYNPGQFCNPSKLIALTVRCLERPVLLRRQ